MQLVGQTLIPKPDKSSIPSHHYSRRPFLDQIRFPSLCHSRITLLAWPYQDSFQLVNSDSLTAPRPNSLDQSNQISSDGHSRIRCLLAFRAPHHVVGRRCRPHRPGPWHYSSHGLEQGQRHHLKEAHLPKWKDSHAHSQH